MNEKNDLYKIQNKVGRKRDNCWKFFDEINYPEKKYKRAKCKFCQKEISGIKSRMIKHIEICSKEIVDDNEELNNIRSIEKFNFINDKEKEELDKKVVEAILWMQLPLNTLEHPGFIYLCKSLHPGYEPCCRKTATKHFLSHRIKILTGQQLDETNRNPNLDDEILDCFSNYANLIDIFCKEVFKIQPIYIQITEITQNIRRNDNIKKIFSQITKRLYGRAIPLINEQKNIWNSSYYVLQNFLRCRESFEELIRENNINDIGKVYLSDQNWWNLVEMLYKTYEPYATLIEKIVEGNSTLSEIYDITKQLFNALSFQPDKICI